MMPQDANDLDQAYKEMPGSDRRTAELLRRAEELAHQRAMNRITAISYAAIMWAFGLTILAVGVGLAILIVHAALHIAGWG